MPEYIGRESRAKAKNRELLIAINKAEELFKNTLETENEIIEQHDFEEKWGNIIIQLSNICKTIRVYKRVHNLLVKKAQHFLKVKNLNNDFLTVLYTHKEQPPLRSHQWISDAWAIDRYHAAWFDKLGKENALTSTIQVYQALMLSFICHSGHADINLVKAFNKILSDENMIVWDSFSIPCVLLKFSSNKHNTNDYINGDPVTVRNCYLSYITFSLLQKWLKIDKKTWRHPETIREIYQKMICSKSLGYSGLPTSLSKFCESAIYVTLQITNKPINEALIYFAIGKLKSYSLPVSNQRGLLANNKNNCFGEQFYTRSLNIGKVENVRINMATQPTPHFFVKLKTIIDECAQSKKSKKSQRRELEKILQEPLTLFEYILVAWFVYKTQSCGPSSIKTYFSILGRSWLKLAGNESFFAMEIDEIEALYLEEIESKKTLESKSVFAKKLIEIHLFAAQLKLLPRLEHTSELSFSVIKHVRSGFVTESIFNSLLESFNEITDLNDQDKVALQAMAIISNRCALRLTEVRKLMSDDIEYSNDGWIHVKSNKYGKNKSLSSNRKVPLHILLLSNEIEVIKKHLQNKGLVSNGDEKLLFTFGSQINDMIPAFQLSNFISRSLRAISGCSHFVFHHFRHSALSRLQLLLEQPSLPTNMKNIIPYSDERNKQIIKKICGLNHKNKYEALAKFAGHQSPETTFKHYFHFSDLILGKKCAELNLSLSVEQVQVLGLASRRVAKDAFNQFNELKPHYFQEYLFKKYKPISLSTFNSLDVDKQSKKEISKKAPNIELCYAILSKIEKGYEISSTGYEFGVDQEQIQSWLQLACFIRDKFILKVQDRPEYVDYESFNQLLPGVLKRQVEQNALDKLRRKMREHFQDKKVLYKNIMQYVIHNMSNGSSGILFRSADDLKWFVNSLESVIHKSNWRAVTYRIEYSPELKSWEKALSGVTVEVGKKASSTGRIGNGSIRLEYISPDEGLLIKGTNLSKYSSHLFIYLIHMQCIMMKGVFLKQIALSKAP